MSKFVIADSSALISLALSKDSNHKPAIIISRQLEKSSSKVIVSREIFSETINVLGKKVGKEIAVFAGNSILKSKLFEIVDSSNLISLSALEKFQKQPGSVSFTDCLVMAFADEFETKNILGFDECFKKSGYLRVGIDKK